LAEQLLSEGLVLPDPLLEVLRQEGIDLEENRQRYPLLMEELDPDTIHGVELAKQALLTLPLTHSSRKTFDGPIAPFIEDSLHGRAGNTLALDQSLGLDHCVFMQWGAVEKSSYGRFHRLVNPEPILTSPYCFVTPNDIGTVMAGSGAETPYDALNDKSRGEIKDKYLSKILSGKDWLELAARQTFYSTRNGEEMDITSPARFGEVKYFGRIPESHASAWIGPGEEQEIWKQMYLSGFVSGPVFRSQEPGTRNDYDVTPQELGLLGTEAAEFWHNLYTNEAGDQ
jgi:hypothetical protein